MVTATATIRAATIEDMPKVVACQWLCFLESPWAKVCPAPDPVYAGGWMLDRLMHDPKSQLFVADVDGELVGIAGGTILDWPMLQHFPYLWEWALWVSPESRHSDVADSLWTQLKAWAKTHEARLAGRGQVKQLSDGKILETLVWETL